MFRSGERATGESVHSFINKNDEAQMTVGKKFDCNPGNSGVVHKTLIQKEKAAERPSFLLSQLIALYALP